jgi:hypothetical protein
MAEQGKRPDRRVIALKRYDVTTGRMLEGETVPVSAVADGLTVENVAVLLDDYCNNFNSSFGRGVQVGQRLRESHRTIQRSIVVELVGVLVGLSEQEYTDLRNHDAIMLAKEIKALYERMGAGGYV